MKVSTLKLSGMIALFEKLIFIEVEEPNFWGGQVEERAKMGNAPNSEIFRDDISSSPQNIITCLVTYFWHITPTFSIMNHQKI